jgi:hypothetical protein
LSVLREKIGSALPEHPLHLIYSEYGEVEVDKIQKSECGELTVCGKQKIGKIDLVCLDPRCLSTRSEDVQPEWWNLPILVGIELKLIREKVGGGKDFRDLLDCVKMELECYLEAQNLAPEGEYIALCFVHGEGDGAHKSIVCQSMRAEELSDSSGKITGFNSMYLVEKWKVYRYWGRESQLCPKSTDDLLPVSHVQKKI